MFPKFRLTSTADQLADWAKIDLSGLPELCVVHNDVFPSVHPVLRSSQALGKRTVSSMRLGLIPSYAHDDHQADHLMEAHAEAMTCCNSFRSAFKRRRCLIPATAFHECSEAVRPIAAPLSCSLKTEAIFAIAGVWESWIDNAGESVESFALIDVRPDPAFREYFERLPVIIPQTKYELWLSSPVTPIELLRPLSVEDLEGWKIMPYVALPSLEARLPDHAADLCSQSLTRVETR